MAFTHRDCWFRRIAAFFAIFAHHPSSCQLSVCCSAIIFPAATTPVQQHTGARLAFGVHSGTSVTRGLPTGTLGGGGVRSLDRGADAVGIGGVCRSHRTSVISPLPAVSELVGASEETGGIFDPLGLAADEVRTLEPLPFKKSCVALSVVGSSGACSLALELYAHMHTYRFTLAAARALLVMSDLRGQSGWFADSPRG